MLLYPRAKGGQHLQRMIPGEFVERYIQADKINAALPVPFQFRKKVGSVRVNRHTGMVIPYQRILNQIQCPF